MGKGKGRGLKWYDKIKKKISPHRYLEDKLVSFEKLDRSTRQLWGDFERYLAKEREKVLPQIEEALLRSSYRCSQNNCGRIVDSKFSATPLSCKGSYIKPPGGRFNFGKSISYQTSFPALYVANNFNSALCEKFKIKKGKCDDATIESHLDLALKEPRSFSYQRIKLSLNKVIDLRNDFAFEYFFEVIKHIKFPSFYQENAKKLKTPLGITTSVKHLKKSIFMSDYEQWDFWIDCPSPSQWFGHYARISGVQGIIYPSVLDNSNFNMVIFPDQLKESTNYIKLVDEDNFVDKNQRRIDHSNFNLFL